MSPQVDSSASKPSAFDWFMRALAFIGVSISAFSIPAPPLAELDASWRMVLGYLFQHGAQFGTDAIFTYGPLGFIMGNTYWGGQWASLIAWQSVFAVGFAAVVCWHAFQLRGYARAWALLFFLIWGLGYQDAAHQIVITLLGLTLIRRSGEPWRWSTVLIVAVLALLSLIKFTNIVLSAVLVLLAGGLDFWLRRHWSMVRGPALYAGLLIIGWMLCGQHAGNLPAYFANSWQISQGYQDAMGFPCPPVQQWTGFLILAATIAYAGLTLLTAEDRRRGLVLALGVGAFIYLNWKHGFIRPDGHQVGFYYAVLTVAVLGPVLLRDNLRLPRLKRAVLVLMGVGSLIACDLVLPGVVRGALGGAQHEINANLAFFSDLSANRLRQETLLHGQKTRNDLLRTRATVGRSTIDVLGWEQGVALINEFNYTPRPVFQGYSAYTPKLAQLNHDFFAFDQAPDYVLFKLQSLDGRLAAMDDPAVLRLIPFRYEVMASELGFTLWRKNDGPFDPAAVAPVPIRTVQLGLNETCDVSDLADKNVWVEIDYQFSLLGKIRRFFLRPPEVHLRLVDNRGEVHQPRLAQPIAAAGFILNPLVDDMMDFLRAFGGTPRARVSSLQLVVNPEDRKYLSGDVTVRLSSFPSSNAAEPFFRETNSNLFHMFVDSPVAYESFLEPNEDFIDDGRVMVLHAPSSMTFDVPPGATTVRGNFGFVAGAYTGEGKTNGAVFSVIWTAGQDSRIVFERSLDPATRPDDRGLQSFDVHLPQSSGRIVLKVSPGPFNINAFDWTGWSAIEFK
ncbi:MAG: hypothetical protein RIS54_1803 [Verrucomicrobiota bacterium]